jgi:hypothetical protein
MKKGHNGSIPLMGALFLASALLGPSPATGQTPLEAACNDTGASPAQIERFLKAAEAATDAGICTAAAEPAVRFNCLALYAERSGDPAACALVDADLGDRQALQDACIAGVAVAQGNQELCETAELSVLRDACMMTLITEHDLDRALCERITEATLKSVCRDGG